MTAVDYLRLWTGAFVRVEIVAEGIPTSSNWRGELLNDADEPSDLRGWFVIVRTPDMRVPGVGSLELRLDRYAEHAVDERSGDAPTRLRFELPRQVALTIEPVVQDPG